MSTLAPCGDSQYIHRSVQPSLLCISRTLQYHENVIPHPEASHNHTQVPDLSFYKNIPRKLTCIDNRFLEHALQHWAFPRPGMGPHVHLSLGDHPPGDSQATCFILTPPQLYRLASRSRKLELAEILHFST